MTTAPGPPGSIVYHRTNAAEAAIANRLYVWWGSFTVGGLPGNLKYYIGGPDPSYGEVIQAVVRDMTTNIYHVFIQLLLGGSHVMNWNREQLPNNQLFDQATGKFWGMNDATYENHYPTPTYSEISPKLDTVEPISMAGATQWVSGLTQLTTTDWYIGTASPLQLKTWTDNNNPYTQVRQKPQLAYYSVGPHDRKEFLIFLALEGKKPDDSWEDVLTWSLVSGQGDFYHDSGHIREEGNVPLHYTKWQQPL